MSSKSSNARAPSYCPSFRHPLFAARIFACARGTFTSACCAVCRYRPTWISSGQDYHTLQAEVLLAYYDLRTGLLWLSTAQERLYPWLWVPDFTKFAHLKLQPLRRFALCKTSHIHYLHQEWLARS